MRFLNEGTTSIITIILGLAIVFTAANDMKQASAFIGLMLIGTVLARMSSKYK